MCLFLEREEGKETERERNISVWLPLEHPLLGIWHAMQARVPIGNPTSNPLVFRPMLNPLSHPAGANVLVSVGKNDSCFTE